MYGERTPDGAVTAEAGVRAQAANVVQRPRVRWLLRRWGLLVADAGCIAVALPLVTVARYEGALHRVYFHGLAGAAAVAVLTYVLVSTVLRVHQGRHPVGSADELVAMGRAVAASAVVLLAANSIGELRRFVPLSIPVTALSFGFVLMLGLRILIRRRREGAARPQKGRRALVFGAGNAGHQLVRSMLGDPAGPYLPVGLLDDDPTKRHVRIGPVRLLGGRDDIPEATRTSGAELMIIALPVADSSVIRELSRRAAAAGLAVKILPTLADLLGGHVGIRDVRDIDIADLLGRRQIDTNVEAIAGYLTGRRVLVTGAGGSIGSELCRQIARYSPAELIMLDRDESALHAIQLSMHGAARLDSPEVVLADIRDTETVMRVFADRRPEVVFHAAALKHLTMLEQYPEEGWKTNVLGTRNVLAAATSVGVTHFINVSTDKAADPVNVLGRTKRTAEQLTASYAQLNDGAFLSVRFGNVLASRGSVLTTFAAQIARGGPLTVTDPDVTRYFMTIPEAVQLVIQAGAIGSGGQALVLDMGHPVRIDDVARQLIRLSGKDIEVVYTGLRPGEKLHEDLVGRQERSRRAVHPLISHVPVPPLDDWTLNRLGRRADDAGKDISSGNGILRPAAAAAAADADAGDLGAMVAS